MDTKQLNKQAMYGAVSKVLSGNSALWSGNQGFARQVAALDGVRDAIETLAAAQESVRTGITADKQRITGLLINTTLTVAGALAAWASENNNEEVRAKADFSESDLRKLRDQQIGDRAREVHSLATEHAAALGEFGVGPLALETLQTRIDAYDAVVGAPRDAQVKTKTVTEAIKEQFALGDAILKERLDKLIEQFRDAHPGFYSDYQNARAILDRGGRSGSGQSGDAGGQASSTPPPAQPGGG
jgi:hypothetical protein